MNWKVIEKTGKPGALIRVVGVGGCGGNAVDHMVKSGLEGVETLLSLIHISEPTRP